MSKYNAMMRDLDSRKSRLNISRLAHNGCWNPGMQVIVHYCKSNVVYSHVLLSLESALSFPSLLPCESLPLFHILPPYHHQTKPPHPSFTLNYAVTGCDSSWSFRRSRVDWVYCMAQEWVEETSAWYITCIHAVTLSELCIEPGGIDCVGQVSTLLYACRPICYKCTLLSNLWWSHWLCADGQHLFSTAYVTYISLKIWPRFCQIGFRLPGHYTQNAVRYHVLLLTKNVWLHSLWFRCHSFAISEVCIGLNHNLISEGTRARKRSFTFTQYSGFSGLL